MWLSWTMHQSLTEILSMKYIWVSLSELALKDEKITKDEYLLILSFADKIETYKELLEKTLEDGIIDGSERFQLFHAKYNILVETLKQSNLIHNTLFLFSLIYIFLFSI